MRATVSLDDDVAAEVERLRRERGIGVSEALNLLARAGMVAPARRRSYRHRTVELGVQIEVHDVADALETLDRFDG